MSSYTTNIEVYYHRQDSSPNSGDRIAPAPQINISPEIYYANESIIGYTYNITLNGYANSLRKEVDESNTASSFSGTIDHIGDIRNIFNFNGGNLTIKYQGGSNVLVAKGCTVKSLQFDNSDNKWVNYAPYTVELEFNEVDLIGCSGNSPIACASTIFHAPMQSTNKIVSDNLVDMKKYKIKEFSDKWTFTIEDDIYNTYGTENHKAMRVSYTLSATGKNFYVNNQTIPAWQQAKLFVQDRLYDQVTGLINSPTTLTSSSSMSACDATVSPTGIHNNESGSDILSGFDSGLGVYNEVITCDTSESDGTFSITYNATLKYGNAYAAKHTFTHNMQNTNDASPETTITVQGTVQGLTLGGFIKYTNQQDFDLPRNGQFIVPYNGADTRYTNAKNYFSNFVGGTTDLTNNFKSLLGVTGSALAMKNPVSYPTPISYSLDHNYLTGAIDYTATYSSRHQRNLQNSFTNISVTRKDPTEIIQEFIIPGRASGPIIQKLNMYNPRTVSINIDGVDINNKGCSISAACGGTSLPYLPASLSSLVQDMSNSWLKTKDVRSVNKIDGSYSFSLEYMCTSST